MRQTPDLDRVQARMQPGALTLHGFLAPDTRKLVDILAADDRVVRQHGLSHERIADRLEALTRAGKDQAERERVVEDRFRVQVREERGRLPSPWGDGLFRKGETRLTDPITGQSFRWTPLGVHLIRAHGFYGGRGSTFRLEPSALIAALGMTSTPGAAE